MPTLYALDEEGQRRLRQMWKWQRNFNVTGAQGFRNAEDSCSISIGAAESTTSSKADRFVRIKITGNTQDGSNKRWKYDWSEVVKSSAGYGGWTAGGFGRTGHGGSYDYAYNSIEDGNSSSGQYHNGVTSTNLTGTLDIKPVPNDTIVLARIVNPLGGGATELWFSYENGIDGACS